jgi:uncharacterized protein YciI
MKKIVSGLLFAAAFGNAIAGPDYKPSGHDAPDPAKPASMFVVDMYFITDPAKAGPFKESHKKWVEKYTADGTFLYAGPKDDKNGGVIIINGGDKTRVAKIMAEDSFVKEGIVGTKITEFNPLFSSRK